MLFTRNCSLRAPAYPKTIQQNQCCASARARWPPDCAG
jgi:hypothetical protein